ncbi:glycosyl hydrolase [Paenibacillus sp. TAF58]
MMIDFFGKAGVRKKVVSLLFLLSLLAPNILLHPNVTNASVVPINSQATYEAKAVLQQLYAISGVSIISGQHDYLESPDEWTNQVKGWTGKYPGLHGYEFGAIMNQSESQLADQRQKVVNSAIAWNQAGGLVTISFHENIPGTCLCWSNVQKEMSQADFDKYVTPGTPQYTQLLADLDKAAVYLGKLRDAGVPVLWRPYHEMNGNWFWWGKKSNFPALWNIMYDRFVNVHKLNNLLWVWSPNAPNASSDSYTATYPGENKVDVLAVDIYDNDYQEYFDNKDLTALKETKEDAKIDFNWSTSAPFPSMQADTFSVRWTGKLKPKYTETYKISTLSDDGIRVWVNGVLVIDSWFNQSWVERSGTIALTAGVPVDLKVEYYDNMNGAVAKVMWTSPSQVKEIIPASALLLP